MTHPTPGQICYAAYVATLPYAEPWTDLSAAAQARWEAAAEAVAQQALKTQEKLDAQANLMP
jgi:hypothetical protein